MRRIPLSSSLLTYLDNLEFEEAALGADEETKELSVPYQEEIAAWEGKFKEERATRRAVIRAEAIVSVRNAQLDSRTTRFGAAVVAESGGDRKGPFFRRFFTIAPSQFVRQALRKQCETTLNVIVAELNKLDKKHPLRAHTEPLKDLATSALEALDARAKVKGERTSSANDVQEWKEGINALRLSTYAELLKIAAEKGYPRTWADSFFPTDATEDVVTEDAPATPEGAAGAPADGASAQAKKPADS